MSYTRHRNTVFAGIAVVFLCFCLPRTWIGTAQAQGQSIDFAERFLLAENRETVLAELVPGTIDYFYWHCLYYQHTQQFAKVDEMLKVWHDQIGDSARSTEIRHRQALLQYSSNPQMTLDYLADKLGLRFDHQRLRPSAESGLATELDQSQISRERLLLRKSNNDSTNFAEQLYLRELAQQSLSDSQLRDLLSRLTRPDVDNLVELIVRDLKNRNSGGFGSIAIHKLLLLSQLDELLSKIPDLRDDSNFVNARLSRLIPGNDVDWQIDDTGHVAYLDRLWSYVSTLGDSHNSLKANVLYRRLVLDRTLGVHDRERFVTYLQLPRATGYINRDWLRRAKQSQLVNLGASYFDQTRLAPVQDDEELVRDYLHHFLVDASDMQEFAPWIESNYLKRRYAEAKITAGLGSVDQWAALLSPVEYKALVDRVDLEFLPTNPRFHRVDQPVEFELITKNIQNLIVKVFEINSANYYRQNNSEISTDINLDGLVPNWQETYKYTDAPALRVKRTFKFDQLDHRGVFIIDFIGNGTSSRVLVRKGELHHLVETTAAGLSFTVLNEKRKQLKDASLWIAGRQYAPGDDGRILVPFSTQPGQQKVIIEQGGFQVLANFYHSAETYDLVSGLYVDREALLRNRKASVVVRPQLWVSGVPAPVGLLKNVRLVVRSRDQDGLESTKTFDQLEISESGETTLEIQVPPRLQQLNLELQATIKNVSTGAEQQLAATRQYQINAIDQSSSTTALHLRENDKGYAVSVRGKTGEPRKSQAVLFRFKHRDFTETVNITLQSNEQGQINLGALADIVSVRGELAGNPPEVWTLDFDDHTTYQTINGTTENPVLLPASSANSNAADYSLLERRGGFYQADHSSRIVVADGLITIGPLDAGDYELFNRLDGATQQIQITSGKIEGGIAFGKSRELEVRNVNPVHIRSVDQAGEKVRLQLGGNLSGVRVHVFATRYLPEFDLFGEFARAADIEPLSIRQGWNANAYLAGRTIGEEYQYILDRQYAERFPGNMLTRPSLLLNPWAIRTTENEVQIAMEGDQFGLAMDKKESSGERQRRSGQGKSDESGGFESLDFLLNGTTTIFALKADENGLVEFDAADLGDKHFLRIVVADARNTLMRTVVMPEKELAIRDLRLIDKLALDPEKHFTKQKQYSILRADQPFELLDVGSARFQQYDTLGDVYRYYMTLTGDTTLAEFSFLMDWPKKTNDEKFELYTKYACHELNFFLMKKDPDYFRNVVAPYLQNKYHTTFIDEFLLDENLEGYLQSWEFSRLNTFEKALLGYRQSDRLALLQKFLGDDYDINPTSRRAFDQWFDMAVAAGGLESEGKDISGRFQSRANEDSWQEMERGLDAGVRPDGAQMAIKSAADFDPRNAAPPAANAPRPEMQNRLELADAGVDRDEAGGDDMKPGGGGGGGGRFRGSEVVEKSKGFAQEELKKLDESRKQVEQYYRRLKPTQEWVENNYWHLPIEQQTATLIKINRFWRAYSMHATNDPFLSPYFPEAAGSFAEMMMALAVLDLPFERPEHEVKFEDNNMQLTPKGDLIAFFEQVRPAVVNDEAATILVSENFFRLDDRTQIVDGKTLEKFVRKEFLPHVVYGGQLVVTNPTSMPQDIDLLIQIPEGAIPTAGSQPTRSMKLDLAPFSTQTVEYQFYFPFTGDFGHYPVHVSREDRIVAVAEAFRFNVIAEPSEIDTTSWAWISQNGSDDQVIDFLKERNLQTLDLSMIAFRMKDKPFFDRAIATLNERLAYDDTLWSYAVHHNEASVIRQFMLHAESFLRQCGPWFDSELVSIQPVQRHWYQHREYWPLINARAHRLGADNKILNAHIWNQYHVLLSILTHQPEMSNEGRLAMTYYLSLQDRIGEALAQFALVKADDTESRMQYDYLDAWLAMYQSDPDRAAAIAAQYEKYPVKRWRDLFAAVTAQVAEIRGAGTQLVDDTDPSQQHTVAASEAPQFEFVVESRTVRLDYQNLKEVTVNYYLMDVELLFSRNPFVQRQEEGFAMIRPNLTQTITLPADATQHEFELPAELRTRNVLVEINGGGQTHSQASYSNSMVVRIVQQYGQLQVLAADTKQPLPQMYVKVYARRPDGSVHYYKDGYTDLRGRFDYASLSNQVLDDVERFSILVIGDEYGAVVREADRPKE